MKYFLAAAAFALALGACATGKTEKEAFTVGLDSRQVFMGEIEAQIDKSFPMPGIKKTALKASYFPAEDAVCLQYKVDFMTYYQFWSKNGRTAFVNALETYKEDYAARNLSSRGGRRALKQYGVTGGYLIWQMNRFTVQARSNINIEMGYSFKSKSPYFTLNQREGTYTEPMSQQDVRTTQQMPLYFTRAQADILTGFFDPDFLRGLVSSASVPAAPVDADAEYGYDAEYEEEIDGDVEGY